MPAAFPAAEPQEENKSWADRTEVEVRPTPVVARRRRWRLAPIALLLALGAALAAGIVVIIKNKDGKEVARVTVPEGGLVEIKPGGDGDKPKADRAGINPDRRAAEWVLSLGGTVKVRHDGKEMGIQAAKDLPPTPFEVVSVDISNNQKVDDAGMEHLKGLTSLTLLHLNGTRVSDTGLAHFKGLTNLTSLRLDGTQVSDAGLVHLKGLSKLTMLALSDTPVSGAGLEHLKGLRNLTELYLQNNQVSDEGLVHLKGLTNLTHFQLGGTRISGEGLAHLKGLTKLITLELSGTPIGDAGLAHLKGLTNLTQLDLKGTRATDAGLKHLAGLGNLKELDLTGTQVTADGVGGLQKAVPKCKIISPLRSP
jgi:hypothetical protein